MRSECAVLFVRAGIAGLALGFFALVGCCSTDGHPLPGFAGVPEQADRSPDFALPLLPLDRGTLVWFLAAGDQIALQELLDDDESPDEAEIAQVESVYGELLDRLADPQLALTVEDLADSSAFRALFEVGVPLLSVHDARVGRDRDGELVELLTHGDIAGLVLGDFVFAFYRQRLERRTAVAGAAEGEDEPTVEYWVLADAPAGDAFQGLVVFPSTHAVPGRTR